MGEFESNNSSEQPLTPELFAYQRYGLLGEPLRKMELAEKVLAGEKLTKTDREDLYFFLSRMVPSNKKKGRPSTSRRDFRIALEFLRDKERGKKGIRRRLEKKYLENCMSSSTFYMARDRGFKDIREFAETLINRPDTSDDDVKLWHHILSQIEKHKDKAKNTQLNQK